MKKENEIDFIFLLQDKTFLDLVKSSLKLEDQLDFLVKKYPGKREDIAYALEFIKANLDEQKRIQEDEAAQMLKSIKEFAIQKRRTISHRSFLQSAWKVAAVLVLVFASSIVLYQQINKDTLSNFVAKEAVTGNEAVLILSDGSKYKLDEDDSKIEYSADGGNVVVRNKREQDEKLKNSHTNGALINQINVPAGHRHVISLSDGTMVVLNSGSKLVFPADFTEKTREVYLVGEGYFEVSKNPQKPFIVKTDKMDIRVLGTKFNVSAYGDEKVTSAVLVEGSVSIVVQDGRFLGNTTKKLTPNQGYFYSSEISASEIKQVDVADYVSWKDGLFRFKDQPLHNVVQRVSKYYNKSILIEGNKLPETLISGKLVLTDDISVLMNYLTKTLEVRYEVKEDGTYLIKEQ